MSLTEKINNDIKAAMLAREKDKLEALRAVKAALLLLSTDKGASAQPSGEDEIKLLQRLVKQRKESATIFIQQGRSDLADVETFQANIIEQYLPQQLSEDEVRTAVSNIITQLGASSPADMGKVIGASVKELAGKADGKLISQVVKELLNT
jgi:uncharacterized protein YqeY